MTVIDVLVGKSIKKHREINAMSQRELARLVAVAPRTIEDFESGRRRVSPQKLFEIAEILGIEVEFLFHQSAKGIIDEELSEPTPNILGGAVDQIILHYDSLSPRYRSTIFSFLSTVGREPD